MKKISLILVLLIIVSILTGCSKSKDAKAAEDAINAIGEVSSESKELIERAEKLYGILTDSEKSSISNRMVLVEAREKYDSLQNEAIYTNARDAYQSLKEVAKLCENGMDDIYGAWYFGIYKADDCTASNFYSKFAENTPHLTKKQLEDVGLSYSLVKDDWEMCLLVAEAAIEKKGDYETVKESMKKAGDILQELTTIYGDYTYYPKLKEYYAAISSYVDFFTSPSGSFKQLSDTVNNYETSIRTLDSEVGFLFNK